MIISEVIAFCYGALRVGRLALLRQGIQQYALGIAGHGVLVADVENHSGTPRVLQAEERLARRSGRLLATRERLVVDVAVEALGAVLVLEASNIRGGS